MPFSSHSLRSSSSCRVGSSVWERSNLDPGISYLAQCEPNLFPLSVHRLHPFSRSVWAIVYTLFLSFAISIGSEVYDSFGPSQPSAGETSTEGSSLQTVVVEGSFSSNNTSFDNVFQNGEHNLTVRTCDISPIVHRHIHLYERNIQHICHSSHLLP